LPRIAVVQDDCFLGETARNIEKASGLIRRAAEQEAGLVLFPEMYLTGYALGDKTHKLAVTVAGSVIDEFAQMAEKNQIFICIGFPEFEPASGKIFNSLVCLTDQGEVLTVYRKIQLYDDEKAFFSPGDEIKVAQTPLGRTGFLICYDLEFPELARMIALQNAEVLLVATANMNPWGSQQDVYVKARAMENQIFLALANRIGREKDLVFCGSSAVVDPMGRILAGAGRRDPALLIADIDLADLEKTRSSGANYLADRRPEIYPPLADT
jgi:predicted amidohydrolase